MWWEDHGVVNRKYGISNVDRVLDNRSDRWGCVTGNRVLVVWTNFWYKPGSPSFGTKTVGMIEAIPSQER